MPSDYQRHTANRPTGAIHPRLVTNGLLPAGVYALRRHVGTSDFRAVTAGAAIPLLSTMGQWLPSGTNQQTDQQRETREFPCDVQLSRNLVVGSWERGLPRIS